MLISTRSPTHKKQTQNKQTTYTTINKPITLKTLKAPKQCKILIVTLLYKIREYYASY